MFRCNQRLHIFGTANQAFTVTAFHIGIVSDQLH